MQSRAWVLSCIAHQDGSTGEAKNHRVPAGHNGMSDGGESPKHGFDEVITNVATDGSNQAYTHFMGLRQHDTYESNCNMMRMLGEALRQKRASQAEESDDDMQVETNSERARG